MEKYNKKFFKISFIFGILCLAIMITFIIFLTKLNSKEKYFLAALTVMVLFFPVVLGFLVENIKYCLNYFKFKKVVQYGMDGVCQIVNYKLRRYNGKNWNIRYALVVNYYEDNMVKTYTTGYDFLAAEYRYLVDLHEIKCKFRNNLLVITEKIPNKIYENLTVYGVEKSKFRRVLINIWQILGLIGFVLMIGGISATILTDSILYLVIGFYVCLYQISFVE